MPRHGVFQLALPLFLFVVTGSGVCAEVTNLAPFRDPSPSVRKKALEALDPDSVEGEALISVMELTGDNDVFVRMSACRVLGQIDPDKPGVRDMLLELLGDNHVGREISSSMLSSKWWGTGKGLTDVCRLIGSMPEKSDGLRNGLTERVRKEPRGETATVLRQAALSGKLEEAHGASMALGGLIIGLNGYGDERRRTALALVEIDCGGAELKTLPPDFQQKCVKALGELLSSKEPEQRMAGLRGLKKLAWKGAAAVPALKHAIKAESNPETVALMQETLGLIQPADWEIIEEEIPSDQEGFKHLEYRFRFLGRPEQFVVGRAYQRGPEENEENREGYCKDAFEFSCLDKNRLVVLSSRGHGEGHGADGLNVVLLFEGGQWQEIYRNCYPSSDWHAWEHRTFEYDPVAKVLTMLSRCESYGTEREPQLLSVKHEVEGGPFYDIDRAFTRIWRWRLAGKTLEFIDGKKNIDLGFKAFPVAEVGKFVEQESYDDSGAKLTVADGESLVRRLNPGLKGKETCWGVILLDDQLALPPVYTDMLYGSRQ